MKSGIPFENVDWKTVSNSFCVMVTSGGTWVERSSCQCGLCAEAKTHWYDPSGNFKLWGRVPRPEAGEPRPEKTHARTRAHTLNESVKPSLEMSEGIRVRNFSLSQLQTRRATNQNAFGCERETKPAATNPNIQYLSNTQRREVLCSGSKCPADGRTVQLCQMFVRCVLSAKANTECVRMKTWANSAKCGCTRDL